MALTTLVQTNKDFLIVGREVSWGSGKGSGTGWGIRARPWSLRNNSARALPEGERIGSRDMDSQASVPGRRYATGDIPAYWRADTGGLFMLAALGTETVAADPVGALVRKKHAIRCADVPPSLWAHSFTGAIEPVGGAERAYEHKGLRLDRFTMNWDATDDTGLLDFTYTLIGLYGQRIAKPVTTGLFTDINVQPSWSAVVNRDTVASEVMRGMTLTFENNVARVKSAVGSRDDQMQQPGGRRVSGTITYIYQNEFEYDLYEALGTEELEIIFTGVNLIENVAATDYFDGLRIHIPKVTFMDYGKEDVDGYYVQRIGFRGFHDDTAGGPWELDVFNDQAAYTAAGGA